MINNRVDNRLAVSRAFGDADFKEKIGSGGESVVTACPEQSHHRYAASDFVVLVSDGVCEGCFRNKEVIYLVASVLREQRDPALAAAAVVKEALQRESCDNFTCLVVCFDAPYSASPAREFDLIVGAVHPTDTQHMECFARTAHHVRFTIPQAVSKRSQYVDQALGGDGEKDSDSLSRLREEKAAIKLMDVHCEVLAFFALSVSERRAAFAVMDVAQRTKVLLADYMDTRLQMELLLILDAGERARTLSVLSAPDIAKPLDGMQPDAKTETLLAMDVVDRVRAMLAMRSLRTLKGDNKAAILAATPAENKASTKLRHRLLTLG